jgi:methionyl-tRNA formyltransferase
MRIGWVGSHVEGILALQSVLESGLRVEAILTLCKDRAALRSGSVDYGDLSRAYAVPLYEIANINDDDARDLLRRLALDIVFVIGWSQIVRPEVLSLARIGMVGAHASLLPRNRGRAPINWALIHGERLTGNSLIWLAESVDEGDIIAQTEIPITPYDSCRTLYEKVAESNIAMISDFLKRIGSGDRPGRPQNITNEPNLPGRRPEDGLLDWAGPAGDVYNFIRAVTRPYPGAFSFLDGRRWRIWESAVLPLSASHAAAPGTVLGPVWSTVPSACGLAVACGEGMVTLLEIEDDEGTAILGNALSELRWTRKTWNNG